MPSPAHRFLRFLERSTKTDLRNLARNGIALAGSDLLISLLGLGLSVLIAALIPKETFGIYRYVVALSGIAVAFSLTGMNSAVTRAVALGRHGVFRTSLRPQMRFALLQVLVIGACAAYYAFKGNETYAIALAVVACLAPVTGVFNTYTAYLNGTQAFGRLGLYRIQGALINVGAMCAVVVTHPTVIGLTVAYFLSTLVTNAWFLRKTLVQVPAEALSDPGDIAYGKHLSVINSVSIVATQLDALLLYHLLGPVALALYSFAILIPERVRAFLTFLPNAALPRLTNRTANEIRATLLPRIGWFAAISSGIALAYALAAPYLFAVLFPAYAEAVPYTQLAGLFAVTAVVGYLSAALTALRAERALYIVSLVSLVTKIALTVGGILLFGIIGALVARLLAACVQGMMSFYFISRA
ncbi:MAG TPA: oligosaccharide flippase family protein [Candidatus Paceibacterota bacterium]|jgi:O-antigen/teichoic acid export membrane protein